MTSEPSQYREGPVSSSDDATSTPDDLGSRPADDLDAPASEASSSPASDGPGRPAAGDPLPTAPGDVAAPAAGHTQSLPPAADELPTRSRADSSRPRAGGLLAAVRETTIVVLVALGLSLLIKTFLIQAFYIPSVSMQHTLEVGDRVVVSKLTPGPFALQRGDVIVFTDPGGWLAPTTPPDDGPVRGALRSALTFVGLLPNDSGNHLIKRLIGLPGDHVACCDAKGRLTVNGTPINEPYVYAGNVPSERPFDITVPAGRVWVMGDHRQMSDDSRYHDDGSGVPGSVPIADVTGRAFVVVWPFDRAARLPRYSSTFANVPPPGAGR